MKNIVDRFPDKVFETHPTEMQLALYQDQKLDNSKQKELQSHLIECKRCRTILIEASHSRKEMELQPINNINYFKALTPLVAGAIIFVTVPMVDKPSTTFQYKGIEIKKGILESSMEYWERLYQNYFGK